MSACSVLLGGLLQVFEWVSVCPYEIEVAVSTVDDDTRLIATHVSELALKRSPGEIIT